MALIRVRKKSTGRTGTMPEENFNSQLYERVDAQPKPTPSVRIAEPNGELEVPFGEFRTVEPRAMPSLQFAEPEKEPEKPAGFLANLREMVFGRKEPEVEPEELDITEPEFQAPEVEPEAEEPATITGRTIEEHRRALSKAEGAGAKKAATAIRKQLAIEKAHQEDIKAKEETKEEEVGEPTVGKITAKDKALATTGVLRTTESAKMLSEDPSLLMKELVPGQLFSRDFDSSMYDAADALLRLRTGAQANPAEIRGYMKKIAPSYGDSPEVAQNKLNRMLEDFATYQGKDPSEVEKVQIEAAEGVNLPTAGLLPATSTYIQKWPSIVFDSIAGTVENVGDLLKGDFDSIAERNEELKPELAKIKKLDKAAKIEVGSIITLGLLGQAYLPKILGAGKGLLKGGLGKGGMGTIGSMWLYEKIFGKKGGYPAD